MSGINQQTQCSKADRHTLALRAAYLAREAGHATPVQRRFLRRIELPAIRQALCDSLAAQRRRVRGWSTLMRLKHARLGFERFAEAAAEAGGRVVTPLGWLTAADCQQVIAVVDTMIAELAERPKAASDDGESIFVRDLRAEIRLARAYESTTGPPPDHRNSNAARFCGSSAALNCLCRCSWKPDSKRHLENFLARIFANAFVCPLGAR